MAGARALRLARLQAAKPALPRPMAAARDVMVGKNGGYVSVFGRSTLYFTSIGRGSDRKRMPMRCANDRAMQKDMDRNGL